MARRACPAEGPSPRQTNVPAVLADRRARCQQGHENRVTLWGRVDSALIGLIVEAVVRSRRYLQRNCKGGAQAPDIVVVLVDRQTSRCANGCCGIGSSMMASYDLCGCGKPIFIVPGRSAGDNTPAGVVASG